MNKMLKQERGITLIALIITIIILVILAAVSIRAVTNMGIVGHAVNGSQGYAQAAKDENTMLQNTETKIKDTLDKLSEIQGGTTSGSTTGNTNPNYSVAVADSDITDPTIFNAEPINTETGALNLAALPTKKAKITGIKSEYLKPDNRYTNGAAGTYDYWGVKVGNTVLDTLVIPDVVTIDNVEYTVTEVDLRRYSYDEGAGTVLSINLPSVKTIVFPNTITTIHTAPFGRIENLPETLFPLENVVLSSGLTEIPYALFCNTNLKSIVIPSNITSIQDGAFEKCRNLTSVSFEGTTLTIGNSAFYGTGLTSATFKMTGNLEIGEYAFGDISNFNLLNLSVGGTTSGGYEAFGTKGEGSNTTVQEIRINGSYAADESRYDPFLSSATYNNERITKVVWTSGSTDTSIWYTSHDGTSN